MLTTCDKCHKILAACTCEKFPESMEITGGKTLDPHEEYLAGSTPLDLHVEARENFINSETEAIKDVGEKFDDGKPIAGALGDFGLALMELSRLLYYGDKKYERSSWINVPNAEVRYLDGGMRHWLLQFSEEYDQDIYERYGVKIGHDVAAVFNNLATLELRLRREKNGTNSNSSSI